MTSPGPSGTPRPARPSFGTCGASCIVRPTPWPPWSVLMPHPPARPTAAIAAEMSPTRPPTTGPAIPARNADAGPSHPGAHRRLGGGDQPCVVGTGGPDREGDGRVPDPAVEGSA